MREAKWVIQEPQVLGGVWDKAPIVSHGESSARCALKLPKNACAARERYASRSRTTLNAHHARYLGGIM